MAVADLLQDFGTAIPGAESLNLVSASQQEEQSIRDYERGYAAGWEDALQLQAQEQNDLSQAIRESLGDLKFTFSEAHQQMLACVAPVFEAVVEHVLPDALNDQVGQLIVGELMQMVGHRDDFDIRICVSPGDGTRVRPVVADALGRESVIEEDPRLSAGEAILRVADTERILDVTAAMDGVRAALQGFAHEMSKEVQHG